MWRAYDGIDLHGYRHPTVNHSENFVDPVSGAHRNNVEGLKSQARAKNRRRFGTHRQMMTLLCVSLCGIRGFEISPKDPFDKILEHTSIKDSYPL